MTNRKLTIRQRTRVRYSPRRYWQAQCGRCPWDSTAATWSDVADLADSHASYHRALDVLRARDQSLSRPTHRTDEPMEVRNG